jgi:hypothetical protein
VAAAVVQVDRIVQRQPTWLAAQADRLARIRLAVAAQWVRMALHRQQAQQARLEIPQKVGLAVAVAVQLSLRLQRAQQAARAAR